MDTRLADTARPFEVVVLAASAGGIEAISTILKDLPQDFAAAVLVAQHLRQAPSELVNILARYAQLPIAWAVEGEALAPGRIYVCPPQRWVDLQPDGTCTLSAITTSAYPIDATLEALAESYRARAAAVILTGMRNDGARGVIALKRHGGTVIAQSEVTAQQPSMPRAAIATGVVDLVLPLSEISRALIALVNTGSWPRSREGVEALDALFGGDGRVRPLLRQIDWAASSLGPVEQWPSALVSQVRTLLNLGFPAAMTWGPEAVNLYNDAYARMIGELHPSALGAPLPAAWPEAWPHARAAREQLHKSGETLWNEAEQHLVNLRGKREEMYFAHSLSAIPDGNQRASGALSVIFDTTDAVIGKRRYETIAALSAPARSVAEAYEHAMKVLGENGKDVPFALVYELEGRTRGTLVASVGVPAQSFMAARVVELGGARAIWPLDTVASTKAPLIMSDLLARFGDVTSREWPTPTSEALLLPLRASADDDVSAVLIAGISPVRILDVPYRRFLELVSFQIGSNLALARFRSGEKHRIRALEDAAQAKSEFFSNVSHEFRTPLTLTLAPLERLLANAAQLPPSAVAELEIAERSGRRLLTLVNALLDFTRVEARRFEPEFERVDLAKETADLVALFRSAVERGGVELRVDCPPLSTLVWLDRGMWEKIVGNLVANALKFTFEGRIEVTLSERAQHAELEVRDTGVGIPPKELPHLFGRFHRVQGVRARTHEGSGIGLALTRELVRLLGGKIRVKSEEGRGTTFTVWIPMQRTGVQSARAAAAEHTPQVALTLAETALAWSQRSAIDAPMLPEGFIDDAPFFSRTAGSRVLVVDDNGDMRAYMQRLLEQASWVVEAVADGQSAFARIPSFKPDLIVTDVMMPEVDGFELLRRIRRDPELQTIPVMLVTARAGEAAAVEGFLAGAADLVIKPFSARELIARIGAQLELSRVRRRVARLDAYRVRLANALRPLTDPCEIEAEACRVLGEQLRVTRAYYAELEDELRAAVVQCDYFAELPSIAGRHRLDPSALAPVIETSRTLAVRDVASEAAFTPSQRAAWLGSPLGAATRALIAVPLVKNGATLAVLTVADKDARAWSDDDITLVEETAERTWDAKVRARAEAETADELRHTQLLRVLGERLADEADSNALYDELLRAAITLAAADAGTVQIIDPQTRALVLLATSGFSPEVVAHYAQVSADSNTSCGVALSAGQRTFIDFTQTPDDVDSRLHLGSGYRCALSTPLLTRSGEVVGMVSTHWCALRRPSERDFRYVDLLARQAADLIERTRMQAQLRAYAALLGVGAELDAALPTPSLEMRARSLRKDT